MSTQATGRVRLADIAPRLAAARDAHEARAWRLDYCAAGCHDSYFPFDTGRCPECGDLNGSTLDTDPYDFSAARRELTAIHAWINRHLEQGACDGQWGYTTGYYTPEWSEVGNTVQALEYIAGTYREEGFFDGLVKYEEGITAAPPVDAEEARP